MDKMSTTEKLHRFLYADICSYDSSWWKFVVSIGLATSLLIIDIFMQKEKKSITTTDIILASCLIGVFFCIWAQSFMARFLCATEWHKADKNHPSIFSWTSILYITCRAIFIISLFFLVLVIFIRSLSNLSDALKDHRASVYKTQIVLRFILVCIVFTYFTLYMDIMTRVMYDEAGHMSSIYTTMYNIRSDPNKKDQYLKDLLCNKIRIEGNGSSNTMTPTAARIFLREYNQNIGGMTRQTYNTSLGKKICKEKRTYPKIK